MYSFVAFVLTVVGALMLWSLELVADPLILAGAFFGGWLVIWVVLRFFRYIIRVARGLDPGDFFSSGDGGSYGGGGGGGFSFFD